VATITIMQAQVEEIYFIVNLECRHATLSRGMLHGLPTKSQCSTKAENPGERRETQWAHTLHISLNQRKLDGPVSQNEGSGLDRLAPTASFQISDFQNQMI
jgi:hypothetical protein